MTDFHFHFISQKASSTTSSKRFPRNVKPLELIAEVNETNAEINGKIANETLQNSSVEKNFKKKESLKRQRDDEKYEKNEKQISKKPKVKRRNIKGNKNLMKEK